MTTAAASPLSFEGLITSLISALSTHGEIVAEQVAIQKQLVAGQQAAIEKLEGAKGATTRTPRAKKGEAEGNQNGSAAEQPSTESKPADTAPAAADASAVSEGGVTVPADVDGLKAYVGAWTGADEAKKAERVDLLKAIAAKFGVKPTFTEMFPHAKKAVFLIERAKLGLEVNLNADYDFDGSPAQGGGEAASSDDDFG